MKYKPQNIILSFLLFSILVFSYMLRIFESPLVEVSGFDFKSIWNCIWVTVITMTSTGYGDMYP